MVTISALGSTPPGPRERRRLQVAALAAYGVVLAVWTWQVGFPTGRLIVFLWAWAATIAWRFDKTLREHLDFLRDWSVPMAVMLFYMYSRALADNLGAPVRWSWPIEVDTWLGFGELPSQRLQETLCSPHCLTPGTATLLDAFGTTVYVSHFAVAWAVAVVLWLRHRDAWVRWMQRLLSLNVLGIAAAVVVPMAPPWLASARGLLTPPVDRLTGRGWSDVGLGLSAIIHGPLPNQVAAMPSLHTATAALVALYAVRRLRTRWRWTALLYPLAMAFTLTYFGEHYVVDEIAGVLLAVGVMVFWSRWDRRASARRTANVGAAS